MIDAINKKLTRLYVWATNERGQTTSEYVAVTAVGVALATVILWGTLSGAITDAVGSIATAIEEFASEPPIS
jgi:hypothetical protein